MESTPLELSANRLRALLDGMDGGELLRAGAAAMARQHVGSLGVAVRTTLSPDEHEAVARLLAAIEGAYVVVAAAQGDELGAETLREIAGALSRLLGRALSRDEARGVLELCAEALLQDGGETRMQYVALVLPDRTGRQVAYAFADGLRRMVRASGESVMSRLDALARAFGIPHDESAEIAKWVERELGGMSPGMGGD